MDILVSAEYKDVEKFRGKSVTARYNGKKSRVFFKVSCDDFTLASAMDFAKVTPSVVALVYQGMPSCRDYVSLGQEVGVCVVNLVEVGCDVTDSDIGLILEDIPAGVVPVLSVPDDYCDLEFVYRMCGKYDRLRFFGGNLFRVPGVRLGCVDEGVFLGKGMQPRDINLVTVDGMECLAEVPFHALEFTVSDKAVRESRQRKQVDKKVKPRMFSGFLDGGSVAF